MGTGEDERSHLRNLKAVLARFKQAGLKLKQSKCLFMAKQVEYFGYTISQEGIHTAPAKIDAVSNAPTPKNIQELRSFLGLVTYYGKFIPHLATISAPSNQLLKHGVKYKWSKDCKRAFRTPKTKPTSASVLVHYDPRLTLRLFCDASSYGVGAVPAHEMEDGSERPVAYASRTLTNSERNCAQIERESLALIFGVKRFHSYLFGQTFTLITDHKPLTTILGPKTGIPGVAAARLQSGQ